MNFKVLDKKGICYFADFSKKKNFPYGSHIAKSDIDKGYLTLGALIFMTKNGRVEPDSNAKKAMKEYELEQKNLEKEAAEKAADFKKAHRGKRVLDNKKAKIDAVK